MSWSYAGFQEGAQLQPLSFQHGHEELSIIEVWRLCLQTADCCLAIAAMHAAGQMLLLGR